VIQHIRIRNKTICLHALDLDSENTTGDHHADFRVLLEGELAIFGHLGANSVIVLLDVFNFFANLVLERTAFEPGALCLGVKNGEIIECLGQNVDILVKNGVRFSSLLHNVSGEERMFW
jgi:hypothetical protein